MMGVKATLMPVRMGSIEMILPKNEIALEKKIAEDLQAGLCHVSRKAEAPIPLGHSRRW